MWLFYPTHANIRFGDISLDCRELCVRAEILGVDRALAVPTEFPYMMFVVRPDAPDYVEYMLPTPYDLAQNFENGFYDLKIGDYIRSAEDQIRVYAMKKLEEKLAERATGKGEFRGVELIEEGPDWWKVDDCENGVFTIYAPFVDEFIRPILARTLMVSQDEGVEFEPTRRQCLDLLFKGEMPDWTGGAQ